MKNTLIIATLLFVFLTASNAKAIGTYKLEFDSLSCLQIEGKISNVEEGNGECLVELISDNDVVQSIVLKEGKHKFKFILNKNLFYAIRISKKGFISKLVSVNTEILTANEGVHMFKFETSLINEALAEKLNQEVIDFPVTIIHFDYETDSFTYNMEYTSYIKKELYKSNPSKIQKPKNVYNLDTTDLAFVSK